MVEQNHATILVVEDEESVLEVLKKRFQSWGYNVQAMTRGKAALEWALNNKLDLVVLDIGLPDLDGYCVCAELRKKLGVTFPVLMLTAFDQPKQQLNGFFQGADAYLTKPYNAKELRRTVEFFLNG